MITDTLTVASHPGQLTPVYTPVMRLGLTVIFAVLWFAGLVAVVVIAVDVIRGISAARHAIRIARRARDRMSAETAITAMLANPDLRALVDENPHLLIPLFDRATR